MAVYKRWDQPGMPQLCGEAGAMIGVLDHVLIAAGWTKEFSDGDRAAYRSDPAAAGNNCYLYVDDTDAQMCLATPYESMSDIDTGTNPAAPAGGLFWRKSTSSNSDPRPWIICADRLRMYINVGQVNNTALPDANTASNSWVGCAGAPALFIPGDPSVMGAGHEASTGYVSPIIAATQNGAYLSRNASLAAVSTACNAMGFNTAAAGVKHSGNPNLPGNGPGSGYAMPLLWADSSSIRCRLPGSYGAITAVSSARQMGDVFPPAPGSVDVRALLALAGGGGSSSTVANGTLLIDHTEPGDWS